jgi:hypothetical protein
MAQGNPWNDINEEDMEFVKQIWPCIFGELLPKEFMLEISARVCI